MPIVINNEHLEKLIQAEQERRGDATPTATARTLLTERLRDIEIEKKAQGEPSDHAASEPVAKGSSVSSAA